LPGFCCFPELSLHFCGAVHRCRRHTFHTYQGMSTAPHEDADRDIKARLLSAVEKWVNDISFYPADEPNESLERMTAWQNLERVLVSLEESLVVLLIFKQRHLVDTFVQHLSCSAYQASKEVWFLAAKCMTHCHKAVGTNTWEPGEFTACDLTFYMLGVVESILSGSSRQDQLKYAIQALELWSDVIIANEAAKETYSSLVECISQLLLQAVEKPIFKQRIASFVQGLLFKLAELARLAMLRPTEDLRVTLPLGGSDELLSTLCTHRRIVEHPLIVLAIIRSHASLCCVPMKGTQRDNDLHATLLAGLKRQSGIIIDFLQHLQLCLADGSLSLTQPADLRARLLTALCSLVCAPDSLLRGAASRLTYLVVTEQRDLIEQTALQLAPISVRTVFLNYKCVLNYGTPFLQGLVQVLVDLAQDDMLGTDEQSVELCMSTDEVMELFLEHVLARAVMYDSSLLEVGKKLAEAFLQCSTMTRTKLAPSLRALLQKGANCGIRGCLQLLEANAVFLGPPPDSFRIQADAARPPRVPPTYKETAVIGKTVVDLTSNSEIDTAARSRDTVRPADSWAFLKPAPAPKHVGAAPHGKVEPSKTKGAALPPAGHRESQLDHLHRIEQEHLADERRKLIRKRIFGELDANPPPNSDDLMGRVDKYAKLSSEFGAHVGWLDTKGSSKTTDDANSWDDQIRQLREAKERTRTQAAQQRPNVTVASVDVSASTADLRRRDENGKRVASKHRSALLDRSDAAEDDTSCSDSARGTSKVADWRTLLQIDVPAPAVPPSVTPAAHAAADVSQLMQMYVSGQMAEAAAKRSARPEPTFSEAMAAISIDPLVRMLLKCDFATLCTEARNGQGRNGADSAAHEAVPIRFYEEEHYIKSFTPLLLAEVKAAVVAYINGDNTSDEARLATEGGGGGSSRGPFNPTSEAVRVKCLLKTERLGQPNLQEVLVTPLMEDRYAKRLNKDDLVLVMKTGAHSGNFLVA
jgi:hypothetical protein